jgi:putative CocE/NonD family hydrolase
MRPTWLLIALVAESAFAQPQGLFGFSDKGTFVLYLNEERAGRISFEWKADGSFVSTTVLTIGEPESRSLVITSDRTGRWARSAFEDRHGRTLIERDGADVTISSPGKTGHGRLPEDMLLFEETAPALISQALRRYDASKGGKQIFGLLELSKVDGGPLTLERRSSSERFVGERALKLTDWVYARRGCELHVLAGEDDRVYLVTGLPWFTSAGISEQHALYVREGYETLRPSPDADSVVSQPRYDIRVESLRIPMRDGVKLAADIYFPVGVAKAPVILTRTPYGKEDGKLRAQFWARRGYIRVIQDVRGRFASEGEWEALIHERSDGYDTVEWLARQPWSTGKVGMIGGSYLGWVQWLAAIEHPPHLTTIIPNVSPPDPFHNLPYDHGAVGLIALAAWFTMIENNPADPEEALAGKNWNEILSVLPVIDIDKTVLGRESLTWRHWMTHPTADAYWRALMALVQLKGVRIPVFHQSGWFDGDGIGTKLNYLALAGQPDTFQKLTIGPWEHVDTATRSIGDRDFGSAATVDLQRDYLRWFDYWLKGLDNGIVKEPLVSMFVMGSNRWIYGAKYPLPETRFEKLYFASGGRLSFTPPTGAQTPDRYVYDPGDPTPDPGYGDSSHRQQVTAERKDILVYTTQPFEKPYTIVGPLSAILYTSSSARDTDWFVHVLDIDPDGKCLPLWGNNSVGLVRARYRNSFVKPEFIQPARIYEYKIDLWHTGITLAPGHCLRVEIASADFPTFSRNLNTGGNNETESRFVSANQALYHDARHASYLLIPVVPAPWASR